MPLRFMEIVVPGERLAEAMSILEDVPDADRWQAKKARKASQIAVALWILLLSVLGVLISIAV